MVDAKDKSKLGYRILLGAVVLLLGGSMLLYLVPQSPVSGEISNDTLAKIGDQSITVQDVRQQLDQIEQRNPNMKPLESLYYRIRSGAGGPHSPVRADGLQWQRVCRPGALFRRSPDALPIVSACFRRAHPAEFARGKIPQTGHRWDQFAEFFLER